MPTTKADVLRYLHQLRDAVDDEQERVAEWDSEQGWPILSAFCASARGSIYVVIGHDLEIAIDLVQLYGPDSFDETGEPAEEGD